jgi:hypothetical protein
VRAAQVFRETVRITLARHRTAAVICALITALIGGALLAVSQRTWVVRADVYVSEPLIVHRLATPFSAVPSQKAELAELPELLQSRATLVALVKRAGLIDLWAASRPLPLLLVDKLRAKVPEADLLDALVSLLEKRVSVSSSGNHVSLEVQWPSPEIAMALAQSLLALTQAERETSTIRALEQSGEDLDERLAAKRVEIKSRNDRIDAELKRAQAERRFALVEGDIAELLADLSRAAELDIQRSDNRISVDVLRRTNAMRFVVVKPPQWPKEPEGMPPVVVALVFLVVVGLSGFSAAFALAMSAGKVVSGGQLERSLRLKVLAGLPTDWGGTPERPRGRAMMLAVALALATGLTLGLSKGNPAVAVAPLLGALALWQLWTQPLKWPLLGLMLIAVTADDPGDSPFAGLWRSPLNPIGQIFYRNIANFTGFEFCFLGLAALMFQRRVMDSGRRLSLDPNGAQAPRLLRVCLVISGIGVLWMVVWGIARGGADVREGLWQYRSLLMLPLLATLMLYAFDFPRDLKAVFWVLVIGSIVKSLLGIYFIYAIANPMGADPPHTTGHDDTMILVTAMVVAMLMVWERPSWGTLLVFVLWIPWVFFAIVLNDRRIAYLDLALGLVAVFLMSPPMHRVKRFVVRWSIILSPVIALYVGVGWNSHSKAFLPVEKLKSVVMTDEDSDEGASNLERDLENYNILQTWKAAGLMFGEGFGHHFREYVPVFDFRQSGFGLIGHNSILWLLWIGGVVGFGVVLFYLAVTCYLLARLLRYSKAWQERVALFASLSIIMTYLFQAFGDMGLVNEQFCFFVSAAVAIIGRLATRYHVLERRLPVPAPRRRRSTPAPGLATATFSAIDSRP